jgi:septal ring factor EnvC (AmiA/AmiB activator)
MQQQPAPAFAVHAEDALKAVQGAISVAAVVPHMQSRADGLRDRLTELSAIRRRMDKQSAALLVAEQDAAAARRELDVALADKKAADAALAQKKAAETKKRSAAAREAAAIAKLVREARDLRDLARKLGRRNLDTAPPSRGSGAFARARGLVPLPVSGQLASRFGLRNENGVTQKGVMIAARAGAQVTAPYDAQVLYSGPFRQYGEIVILGLEGGFQMILAGLERADGFVGQELLAGEPISILADGDALGRELGASTSGRSQLYMELRFKGDPIDPTPWLKQTG